MSTKSEEHTDRSSRNFLINLLRNVGGPTLVIIIGLLIEYRSGFFQTIDQTNMVIEGYYLALSFIVIALAATLLFIKDSFSIWLHQRLYLREQLSLLLFFASISVTLLVIASVITGIMPWSVLQVLYSVFIERSFPELDNRWTDYAFLIALYLILLVTLHQLHRNWRGLTSIEQHQREQLSEHPNFFAEGATELRRLIRREQPLEKYTERDAALYIRQLEPVEDTLAWKDQARELIRLSSPSYPTFRREKVGC